MGRKTSAVRKLVDGLTTTREFFHDSKYNRIFGKGKKMYVGGPTSSRSFRRVREGWRELGEVGGSWGRLAGVREGWRELGKVDGS